jgi:ribosomal protein L35
MKLKHASLAKKRVKVEKNCLCREKACTRTFTKTKTQDASRCRLQKQVKSIFQTLEPSPVCCHTHK